MHSKLIKRRNYSLLIYSKVDKSKQENKDEFEAERPKDFSDLVSKDIRRRSNDEEDRDESGLFEISNFKSFRKCENIQEAKDESNSSSKDNQKTPNLSKMESFLNQFNDPKSSASSECLNKQIRLHSSSQESLSKQSIIHQVQETKFVTDGVSQLNHDSEMVDKYNEDNVGNIVRSKNDTRVVRSDISEETSRRLQTKRMIQNNVGKSTRSRNLQNPIKASFGSTDSYQKLVDGKSQDQITIDKTKDATLQRMKSRKLKKNEASVKMLQESNEEMSDFESFRNPGSDVLTNYKSSFIAGKVHKQIEGEEEIELVTERREKENKTRNLPLNRRKMMKNTDPGFTDDVNMATPKIMGFFEDPMTQQFSRNTAQLSYKTSTIDQSKLLNKNGIISTLRHLPNPNRAHNSSTNLSSFPP
jgi:hypothetical protein